MAAETGQLQLVTPTQGTLSGTWGDTVNNGITEYVNIAIAGTLSFAGDGAITLANTIGSASATNIGSTTAQYMVIRVTGTQTVTKVITGPSYSKLYMVDHAGATSAVTFKAAGQTGVTVAVGEKCFVYYNGTDYVKVASSAGVTSFTAGTTGFTPSTATTGAVTLAGTLATTNGGTGLTSFTANSVVYASSTSALATGSAFNFNGTKVSIGTTEANRALNAYELNNTAYTTASFWNLDYAGIFVRNTSTTTNTLAGIGFSGGTSGNSISGIANILESVNAGALGFYTGGASASNTVPERMRIASNGSVGIGTNAPSYKLDVFGAVGDLVSFRQSNVILKIGTTNIGNGEIYYDAYPTASPSAKSSQIWRQGSTESMRLDTSGNLLLGGTAARGTTAGAAHLDLFNGTAPAGTLTNGVSLYSASGDLKFMDAAGNAYSVGYRNIPQSGSAKTSSYTLATTDVGEFIEVGASGAIVVPNATFSAGDVVSIFNNTSGSITMTMSITTAYIGGTDSDKATISLATRGVATVLFISGTVCVVNGNVS